MAAGAATLLIAACPAYADGATSPTQRATLNLRILIPAVVRAAGLSSPARLEIGEQDVARGYVELDAATSLSLTSNSRAGYSVFAVFDHSLLSRVVVRVQGQDLEFNAVQRSGVVNAARMTDAPVNVGYRLYLNAGTVVGQYRWPVALSFGAFIGGRRVSP